MSMISKKTAEENKKVYARLRELINQGYSQRQAGKMLGKSEKWGHWVLRHHSA